MLKYVYTDGVLKAYSIHPLHPWEEPEEVQPTQDQIETFLANHLELERGRIRALREERFRDETDRLHWDALDLEKAGEDASQAWTAWLAAKQAIREALPYPGDG